MQHNASVPKRYQVTLGTVEEWLFGDESGTSFSCTLLGFIPNLKAYIVRNVNNGAYYQVPHHAFDSSNVPRNVAPLKPNGYNGLRNVDKYNVGQRVPYSFNPYIHDANGVPLTGKTITARITHRWYDAATNVKWYAMEPRVRGEMKTSVYFATIRSTIKKTSVGSAAVLYMSSVMDSLPPNFLITNFTLDTPLFLCK